MSHGSPPRFEGNICGAGELRDLTGPGTRGIDDPARGEHSRIRYNAAATAILDDDVAYFA
jgi:hypothetical protein